MKHGFSSALVTGSTGFIGSALVVRLSAEGKRVYCLTKHDSTHPDRVTGLPGVEVLTVSSFAPDQLDAALGKISADVVFHLAAYGVSPDHRDPRLMIEGNIHPIVNLLLAIRDWPIRKFIHTGSCAEYGEPAGEKPITENTPIRPMTLYGAAKSSSVFYGQALADTLNIPFAVLRLFGVYGPGEAKSRLLPYLIDSFSRNRPAELTPGGQVRDFLYVEDVVDAYLCAANTGAVKGIYNVCSGIPLSVKQVSLSVAAAMEKPADLLLWGKKPYRPDEPRWLAGDHSRFRNETGWKPSTSLEKGILMMIEHLASGDQ